MGAKKPKEDALVKALLAEMREQGLNAQVGGFDVDTIPTGISSFDVSTGVGGLPLKRVTVLRGKEASGKTLILLSAIASLQKAGGRAAFVDAEHALTPGFARMLGVDYDSLVISRPTTLNEAYDVFRTLCSSGLFGIVGFDSATALATEEDLMTSARDSGKRASEAQVHSAELKKMIALCHPKTAMVMIGQLRTNPNPPPGWRGPAPEYMPGGRALQFYASLLVEVKTTEVFRNGSKQRIGHKMRTTIVKNKVAQPYRVAEFDLNYETGLDTILDLINTAILTGIIKKKSSHFYFDVVDEDGEIQTTEKANGRAAIEKLIKGNSEYVMSLKMQISGGADPRAIPEHASGWDEIADGD